MKSIVAAITCTIALTAAPMVPALADRVDEGRNDTDRILFCDIFPSYCPARYR